MHLLDLCIKTINFLFYYYVFNSNQKWLNICVHVSYFLRRSTYMINISWLIIFHIIPFISQHSYIIPWVYRFSGLYHDLGLIKGMIWKVSCNDLFILTDIYQCIPLNNKLKKFILFIQNNVMKHIFSVYGFVHFSVIQDGNSY